MAKRLAAATWLVAAMALPAAGQINWSDDPAEWPQIKEEKGKVSKGLIDFDDDPDYGIIGFEGPLTSEGAGPVAPGVVLDNVVIDTVVDPRGRNNLVGVGPFAGFGNPSNAILANSFTDSFQIELTEPNHTMVMLNVLSLLGSYTVDVSFYDKTDRLIGTVPGLPAPAEGNSVLFWTQSRETIGRIVIFDPGNGAEGIMQTEYWIPEPVTLSLLALGGLAALRRRR